MRKNLKSINLKGLSREEWKQLRQGGIGGSDVGAILGKSTFKTAVDAYVSKINPVEEDDPDNMHFWLGHVLEPVINERFEMEKGLKVWTPDKMYVHPDYDYFRANLDGIILKKGSGKPTRGVMECKTTTSLAIKDLDTVVLPSYYLQIQYYMYITGLHWGYIAVFVMDKKEIEFHYFDYSEELMKEVIPKLHEFWERVQKQNPPPLQKPNKDACTLYPRAKHGTRKEVDIAVYQDVKHLLEVRKEKKKLDETEDRVLGRIKKAMGDKEELRIAGEKLATWKNQSASRFDTKRFKKEHPDTARKYSNQGETRVFRPMDIDEDVVIAKLDEMFTNVPDLS